MKILILEPIHDDAVALLQPAGAVRMIEHLEPGHVVEQCVEADAVVTRGRGRIPRAALLAGQQLKCVARCGAGTDNIDVAAATELKIPVVYSPDATTIPVAEHALMLMLAVNRRVAYLDRAAKAGDWEVRSRIELNRELYGKTLGILGLGRIGKRTAELGAAFGMRVLYWSRCSRDERFGYVEADELFKQSDVLAVSLSLSDATQQFVNAERLALLKPSAILVNTGRGEMVDEAALVSALQEKRLAGAGLDVLAQEPPPANHPLFQFENVVITPHVATFTDVAYRGMCVEAAEQVVRLLRGEPPNLRNIRNPAVLLKQGA